MHSVFSLTSHHFAAEGGLATLGVDVKALILQIITFVVVFWLLKRFAFSKIVSTLEARRKTIDNGIALGRAMEAEKATWDAKRAERLKSARAEADDILTKAHQEASEILKNAEAAATRKADNLISAAQARIEDDVKQARRKLEQDMLSLVAEATEVVIDEKLDTKKDNALISRALSGVKK